MDREQLDAYQSKKAEIQELEAKLRELPGNESLIGNSVILDYRRGYPQPQSVVGYDYDLEQRRRERWEKRLEILRSEVTEVEDWIEAIPDSLTRRIFRMYYCEGMKQSKIAKKVHLSQSVVSEKMSIFLNSDKIDRKV